MPAKICPQCAAEYELNQKYCTNDGAVLRTVGAEESLVGRIIGGREILRQLGEGGMGQVFLAEYVRTKRRDALKVMRPDIASSPDAVARFNREATNASRINHPNVAIIYDVGDTDDGMPYMAMEYVDGPSLSELQKEVVPMPPRRAVRIVRQAAAALHAAHELGIVHRDLKPANIMIARKPEPDTVKLVDFGISKMPGVADQQVTTSGVSIGSPAFMSPEQVTGEALDARSDIYSLGLVAFDLLTGRLPFAPTDGPELMWARIAAPALRLEEALPTVRWGPEVERVMARVLSRDVADRYSSAVEFARDLEAAVEAMSISRDDEATVPFTPAPAAAPVTVKKPQRNWMAAAGVGVAAVALIGVTWFVASLSPGTASEAGTAPTATGPDSSPSPTPGSQKISARAKSEELPANTKRDEARRAAPPPSNAAPTSPGTLGIRVDGLADPLRARVDSVLRVLTGVRKETSAGGAADLVLQADGTGRLIVSDRAGRSRTETIEPSAVVAVLPGLIRHAQAAAELAALDAGAAPGDLRIEFANGRRDFAVGEQLRWRVRSARGGFLTLVDIGPAGTVTVLNPSYASDVERIGAAEDATVPRATMGPFNASLPAGAGSVRAIVTDSPLRLQGTESMLVDKNGPRLAATIRGEVARLSRSGGRWSTASVAYSVRP